MLQPLSRVHETASSLRLPTSLCELPLQCDVSVRVGRSWSGLAEVGSHWVLACSVVITRRKQLADNRQCRNLPWKSARSPRSLLYSGTLSVLRGDHDYNTLALVQDYETASSPSRPRHCEVTTARQAALLRDYGRLRAISSRVPIYCTLLRGSETARSGQLAHAS